MSNELAITPIVTVGDGTDHRTIGNSPYKAQESEDKQSAEAVDAGQDGTAIETEMATLSTLKLIILGAGMFMLWACNAGGVVQTGFMLPVMAKEFNVSAAEIQWVAASCMIVWGCFQVIAGRLCDIFGRKRGLLTGASIWILANILTAFMPNIPALNVCRGIAGLGAAILLPASSGIVGAMYPAGKKRTFAFVAISAGGAGGASSSELFAGLFLEYNRWTWIPPYLINAIASLICPIIVIWLVPNDIPHARSKKMDWIGSALLGTSLFLLLFSFTAAQTASKGWRTPYVPVLLILFAVLLALFILRQRQLLRAAITGQDRPPPLIPASLLTKECWNLLIIYIASFCTWAGLDTLTTPVSYLYMEVLGMNKFEAGLKLSICFFSGLGAALLVAATINTTPPRALIAACCTVSTIPPILFAVRGLDWPYWYADIWAMLLIGFATDATVAAGLTIISMTAPIEDGSVASAIFQTSCRLGYPIGLAISTLVSTSVEKRSLAKGAEPRAALVDGIRSSFWVIAGFVLLAALVVGFGMRGWTMLDGKTEFRDRHAPVEAIDGDTRETTPTLDVKASCSKA